VRPLLWLILFAAAGACQAQALPPAAQQLLDQARQEKWYPDAEKLAPTYLPTSDGRSFVVVWKPENASRNLWVVSLHGSEGFATNDLAIWGKYLAPRGIGLIALQWWLGGPRGTDVYLPPERINRELDIALKAAGVPPGNALLQGFSRGSANLYAVAALAATRPVRNYALFVANAGRMSADYPPNRALMDGRFGRRPLADTRWITVCGGRDPNPERDGCPGMRATGQWLAEQGAQVVDAIEDPHADHGVFHRNPQHVNRVLDRFEAVAGR
jgi:hypothetical protein